MQFLSRLRHGGISMADVLAMRSEYRLQQWAQVVKACNASGLSNREYCRQHNISEKTYYYWVRRLRQAAASQIEARTPTLVQLEPAQPASRQETDDMLYIRFRGAELTLPGRTDMDTVAALLKSIQRND